MALFFAGSLWNADAMVQPFSTSVVFYGADHLGSTRVVTDSSGAEQARYSYYPYGELLIPPNPPLKKGGMGGFSPYLYTSQLHDSETNLYYYGARYYDSTYGMFLSRDFIREYPNPYAYVRNNPLRYGDPLGMSSWDYVDGSLVTFGRGLMGMGPQEGCLDNPDCRQGALGATFGLGLLGGALTEGVGPAGFVTCPETAGVGCAAGALAEGYGALLLGRSALNTAMFLSKSSDKGDKGDEGERRYVPKRISHLVEKNPQGGGQKVIHALEEFFRIAEEEHGITFDKAGIYGSYRRGEARLDSDVDLALAVGKNPSEDIRSTLEKIASSVSEETSVKLHLNIVGELGFFDTVPVSNYHHDIALLPMQLIVNPKSVFPVVPVRTTAWTP
jgi:RHS repeat-associated protein